jgi:hypothetical protein
MTSEALAIDALLEELGGEIPDGEVGEAISALLDEHTEDLNGKVDGYVALIAEYDARAEFRRRESKRILALAIDAERKAEMLRERLKLYFERTGRPKIETGRFVVSVVRNGGVAPLLMDVDPEKLPEEFRREVVTYRADSDAIRAALGRGEELPFARLGERGTSLRIR